MLKYISDGKRHTIELASDENLTVGDLMNAVEKEFDIHRSREKLILRGKSLLDEDAEIYSIGIKTGSRIMLIGKVGMLQYFPSSTNFFQKEVADHREINKLNELEVSLSAVQTQLASLKAASDCITSSTADCVRKKLMKDIIAVTEVCVKNLEIADSIMLPVGDAKERERRKSLADSFNDLIVSAEQLQFELDCVCNESPITDPNKQAYFPLDKFVFI
ncbi:BAG family molecular chaperone regulator 1 [Taenia solium]|eukprot:TsM_000998500 transcript=TsM_000998500 gene=TsM_000998500